MARLLSEAVAAFEDNGVPVALVKFSRDQEPPYAKARLNDTSYFFSDDATSRLLCDYDIILYAERRDVALEHRIEDALAASEITIRRKSDGEREDLALVTVTFDIQVFER